MASFTSFFFSVRPSLVPRSGVFRIGKLKPIYKNRMPSYAAWGETGSNKHRLGKNKTTAAAAVRDRIQVKWSFFEVIATSHCPLTSAIDNFFSGMLGIEPGAAGYRTKDANNCTMLPPPPSSEVNFEWIRLSRRKLFCSKIRKSFKIPFWPKTFFSWKKNILDFVQICSNKKLTDEIGADVGVGVGRFTGNRNRSEKNRRRSIFIRLEVIICSCN